MKKKLLVTFFIFAISSRFILAGDAGAPDDIVILKPNPSCCLPNSLLAYCSRPVEVRTFFPNKDHCFKTLSALSFTINSQGKFTVIDLRGLEQSIGEQSIQQISTLNALREKANDEIVAAQKQQIQLLKIVAAQKQQIQLLEIVAQNQRKQLLEIVAQKQRKQLLKSRARLVGICTIGHMNRINDPWGNKIAKTNPTVPDTSNLEMDNVD